MMLNFDGLKIVMLWFLVGAFALGAMAVWMLPKLWGWLKPLIHGWTA